MTVPVWFLPLAGVFAALAVACGSSAGGGEADAPTPVEDAASVLADRFADSWPDTDFTRHAVAPDELVSGGVGKDGIPAIDAPKFVPVDAASFLNDQEPVIVVELNGEARAYPVQVLIWHEIVNDTLGGVPVAVTYCPLCNSAIAFERELDRTVYDFGVSGLLRHSDLVMYDRQTESWWQQLTGEAIVGRLTGTVLPAVPAATVSFADFRSTHPDGLVLSQDTGFARNYGQNPYVRYDTTDDPFLFAGDPDSRLDAAERVVAVEIARESVAYPFSRLAAQRVVEDTVGGRRIVVFFEPGTVSALDEFEIEDSRDVGASGVFFPEADGRALTFRLDGDDVVDNETGSMWNILGRAVDGPLAGSELEPVLHGDHFWFAWAVFKPETRVWAP